MIPASPPFLLGLLLYVGQESPLTAKLGCFFNRKGNDSEAESKTQRAKSKAAENKSQGAGLGPGEKKTLETCT